MKFMMVANEEDIPMLMAVASEAGVHAEHKIGVYETYQQHELMIFGNPIEWLKFKWFLKHSDDEE